MPPTCPRGNPVGSGRRLPGGVNGVCAFKSHSWLGTAPLKHLDDGLPAIPHRFEVQGLDRVPSIEPKWSLCQPDTGYGRHGFPPLEDMTAGEFLQGGECQGQCLGNSPTGSRPSDVFAKELEKLKYGPILVDEQVWPSRVPVVKCLADAPRDITNINHVQITCEMPLDPPVAEIPHHPCQWPHPSVTGSYGNAGPDDDDILSGAGSIHGSLFGKPLAPAVRADHVIQRGDGLLGDRVPPARRGQD